jgi:Predicted periplasmic ligand-binding sensor domain
VLALLLAAALARAAQPPGGPVVEDVRTGATGDVGGQVRSLAATADDRLFVGTEAGVARFDGDTFHPLPVPPAVPHPFAVALAWHQGALYVQSTEGLYRVRDGQARMLQAQEFDDVNASFATGPDGRLYVADALGLFRIEGDQVTTVLEGTPLRAVLADANGFWLGGPNGLYRYDGALRRVSTDPTRALLADGDGVLVGSEAGILRMAEGVLRPVVPDCYTTALARYRPNRAVASCGDGLRLEAPDGSWESFSEDEGLPARVLTRVAVDPEGSLWFGTLDQGLLRIA